jgi:ABC-2 type transport system permease protein
VNPAIWKKAVSDAWRLLLASVILLVVFSWLFVWLMSQFSAHRLTFMLSFVPAALRDPIESMTGVHLELLTTPLGRLSTLYVHVVTMLVCVGWALARGSDSISGEIGRGTMDLVLTLPVRRATVMLVPAVVATIGALLLVFAIWLGTWLGLLCFRLDGPVALARFLPGAVNLFAMIFCFTGITTLISSWNRDRWRTMAWAGGVFILSLILDIVARSGQSEWWVKYFSWLQYCTFLAMFQPQRLILQAGETARLAAACDLGLIGLGLASYALAAAIFWRRDIPAAR